MYSNLVFRNRDRILDRKSYSRKNPIAPIPIPVYCAQRLIILDPGASFINNDNVNACVLEQPLDVQ